MSQLDPTPRFTPPPRSDDEVARAFDDMVRACYGRLCSFVYRYVSSADAAEDVVQDMLVKAWRRRDQIDYGRPLPYLYQAARNEAISHQRRVRSRQRTVAEVAAGGAPTAPDAGKLLDRQDLAAAVATAVDALPDRCRQVFAMQREQGMTYAEIASTLGVSVKTVETHMSRAFRALRQRLVDYLVVALAVVSAGSFVA